MTKIFRENSPEKRCTKASLADYCKKSNNSLRMHTAPQYALGNIQKTLGGIPRVESMQSILKWRAARPFVVAYFRYRLRRNLKRMKSVSASLERVWNDLRHASQGDAYFFRVEPEVRNSFNASCIIEDMRDIRSSIPGYPPEFADILALHLPVVARIEKLARNIGAVLPVDNVEMLKESERQHEAGELVNFETLLNEVHGVR